MRTLVVKLSKIMSIISGIIMVSMVLITFMDIVMRYMGRPIPGVYEIIAFLGIAVAGLALPRASLMKAHVGVDLITERLPDKAKMVLNIITRSTLSLFFLVTAWYFVGMTHSFIATRTVTMTLKVPFYPVVIAMVISCLVQCLVAIYQIVDSHGGAND